MDFRKKFKKFFDLSCKADGFTLVEMIVVIAVLTILGGVAVPAYNGYVEKAERAADEQLLNAVNKAYASACLQNGTDVYLLEAASMPLNADKTVNLEGVQPYGEQFKVFYAGNESSAFKVYENIVFDDSKHMFVDLSNASSFSISVGDVVYKASAEDVLAFKNSSLGQLGADQILTMVGGTVDAMGEDFATDALPKALGSAAYKAEAAKALGLVAADADEASAVAAYEKYKTDKNEAAIQQYYNEKGWTNPNPAQKNEAKAAAQAQIDAMEKNMVAVVGTSKSEEAASGLVDILKGDNAYDTLNGNVKGNNGDDKVTLGMSQSALAFALYSSYAGEEATGTGFVLALKGMNDGFKEYLEDTDRVNADLAGAMGAMNVVGNQDYETVEHTITNGVTNEAMAEALQQILGK